jgi:predicted MFS family arabinose efflux permease
MTQRQLKNGYFALEGINAFATSYYLNYLFFLFHEQFGFGNENNLWVAALNGFVYMISAWFGGRFAQRFGYFPALRIGFGGMALAMILGTQMDTVMGHCAVMVFWTLSLCFTWPTMEAMVSEGESAQGLQKTIGLYNVVWAAGSAFSYFLGGAMLKYLGMKSLFWLPLAIHLIQLVMVEWLHKASACQQLRVDGTDEGIHAENQTEGALEQNAHGLAFLRMAWVANPFAYVAVNTVVAVIPSIAQRLHLSLAMAGMFCSIWFFARLISFFLFWGWSGWHYRFGWLISAYVLLVGSFFGMLMAPSLLVVAGVQIVFGFAIGLIYYSSLFYSMHVGDTKGEHGGFHESAIGAGIFVGPAIGSSALYLFPGNVNSGAWAVSALLVVGGAVIMMIRLRNSG